MSNNLHCCIDCNFFNDKTKKCTNNNGLLKDIEQTESMSKATHSCDVYEEACYIITPKGCLSLALNKANIHITDKQFNILWDDFAKSMENAGYIHNE